MAAEQGLHFGPSIGMAAWLGHSKSSSFVTCLHVLLAGVSPHPGLSAPCRFSMMQSRTPSHAIPVFCLYACWSLRMSLSPASRMAMVEHRKSLPQAVPSSIFVRTMLAMDGTLQSLERLLLWVGLEASPSQQIPRRTGALFSECCRGEIWGWKSSHWCRCSGGQTSWPSWSSYYRVSHGRTVVDL